nr:AraC family transcriptional regulator ligand-binding domain-containing protein [Marinicella sp. W31]MDC2878997.1 AraC family transcriptional regulator ligand-binding domain-containing protein [Marinicella sp. W31]
MRTFEAKTSIDMFDLLIDLAEKETLISAPEAGRFRRISAVLKQDHSTASHMGEEAVLEFGTLLVDRWGGPEVGAVLALKTDLTRLGILGQLILQSETPHAVFYQMARFNRLLNQRSAFELSITPYRLTMMHTHVRGEPKFTRAAQFGTIWALANVALIPEHVFGAAVLPVSAHFDFPAPSHLEPINRVFGPSVHFDQPHASVVFDRARLSEVRKDISFPVFKALEDAAERGLDDVPALDSLAGRVRHHIGERMAGSIASQSDVATRMGISVRSMQRKLSDGEPPFAGRLIPSAPKPPASFSAIGRFPFPRSHFGLAMANWPPSTTLPGAGLEHRRVPCGAENERSPMAIFHPGSAPDGSAFQGEATIR